MFIGSDYRPSAAEINYNLNILEGSKETSAASIATRLEFITLFREAVAHLNVDNGQKRDLNNRLDLLENYLRTPGNHPVKASPAKITDIAHLYPENHVTRKRLEELSEDFDLVQIYGDGHCLFRSIGVGAIQAYLDMPPEEKSDAILHLNQQVNSLKNDELNKLRTQLFTEINALKALNSDDITGNRQLSDLMVKFLRKLAAEYNRQNPTETLIASVEDLNKYCDEIATTSIYGGEAEMFALAHCLGFTVTSHDASIDNDHVNVYEGNGRLPAINLLFRQNPSHYDLLVSRAKQAYTG